MKLQKWLYSLGLRGYKTALQLASPFYPKAKKMVEGQQQLLMHIRKAVQHNTAPVAWFHCASLGEFEQGRPVIEAFRQERPEYKIFLTFFSPSGYEIRKNYSGANWIFYLPLDSAAHAKAFVAAIQPQIAIFVKYEFWYFYLQELHRRQIPTLLISAIFRPEQLFFKPYGHLYRQMLHFFSHHFVQNEASAKLLKSAGVEQVSVAGDTRFDRVLSISQQAREIPLAKAFASNKPIMVVGSSWQPDIAVLAPLVQQYKGRVKFIIAPHEIAENSLKQTEDTLGVACVRFTKTNETAAKEADVLLVDTIGMLSSLYALGSWAYVGGSFGKGLHNTLEAAVWGIPVFFGNQNYQKFAEALALLDRKAAWAVADSEELLQVFSVLFEDEQRRKESGQAAALYVKQLSGATARIMNHIKKVL